MTKEVNQEQFELVAYFDPQKYDPWFVYHSSDQDWIKYLINWGWHERSA
jgi:hypothetical protein